MRLRHIPNNQKGAVLLGVIIVLMGVTALGSTLVLMSQFELKRTASEKCMEVARYNSESSTISVAKLVRLVLEYVDDYATLGIPGGGTLTPGIVYPDDDEEAFALKVLGGADDEVCEDVSLVPAGFDMDAGADIQSLGATATQGTAANVQSGGYSYGIGLGGAGGGGTTQWFVIVGRGGGGAKDCRHISYSRYRRVIGISKGM
jgi:hypothetical protein